MTSPRTKVAPVEAVAGNGTVSLPPGSQRAAERRQRRAAARAAEIDPLTQARIEYQQLAAQVGDVLRDKATAQKAAEMADTLLGEARRQLDVAYQANADLAHQVAELNAELDDLYDAHPELVADDPASAGN